MIEESPSSFILPNLQPSDSQKEKLQSCGFACESESDTQSSLLSEEQATGIVIVSLAESSDDYQTPPDSPEHHQEINSGEGDTISIDDIYNRTEEKRMVDITTDTDDQQFLETNDTIPIDDNNDGMVEGSNAHKLFDEMPVREQEENEVNTTLDKIGDVDPKGKRRLPGSLFGIGTENKKEEKQEVFVDMMNRALKILKGEGKGDDVDDDVEYDFLETAVGRGLTIPRPRWWPPEGGFEN